MNRFLLRTFLRYLVALPVLGFLVIFLLVGGKLILLESLQEQLNVYL